MEYLSFEKPIEELEIQLNKALELADDTGVDMAKTIEDIRKKLVEKKKRNLRQPKCLGKSTTFSSSSTSIYPSIYRSPHRRELY